MAYSEKPTHETLNEIDKFYKDNPELNVTMKHDTQPAGGSDSANYVQKGRTIACGHCEPEKYGEGLKLLESRESGYVCDCICHDASAEETMEDRFNKIDWIRENGVYCRKCNTVFPLPTGRGFDTYCPNGCDCTTILPIHKYKEDVWEFFLQEQRRLVDVMREKKEDLQYKLEKATGTEKYHDGWRDGLRKGIEKFDEVLSVATQFGISEEGGR